MFNVKSSFAAAALAGIALVLFSSAARAETGQDRPPSEVVEHESDDAEAFRIGAIGGVGFPHPLAIEGLIKIEGVLALGVEYSVFPKTNIAGVDTSLWAIAGDARLFPFKNGFFIGVRAGHQVLTGTATVNLAAYGSYSESGTAETWFVNPRIGFLWTWRSGITVGIDAGVQLPIGASLTTTLPDGLPPQVSGTIASVANTFGNGVTPTIDLLRIGFLF